LKVEGVMKSVETLSEKLRGYFVQRDEIRLVYIFESIAKAKEFYRCLLTRGLFRRNSNISFDTQPN